MPEREEMKDGQVICTWKYIHAGTYDGVPVITVEGYNVRGVRLVCFSLTIVDAGDLIYTLGPGIEHLLGQRIGRFVEVPELDAVTERLANQQKEIENLRFALGAYGEESHWDKEGKCVGISNDGNPDRGKFARTVLGDISHLH